MYIGTVLGKLVAYDHLAMATHKSILEWFIIYFLTRNRLRSYIFQIWVCPQGKFWLKLRKWGSFRSLSRGVEKNGWHSWQHRIWCCCSVMFWGGISSEHRYCGQRRSRSVSPFFILLGKVNYSTLCPAQTQCLSTFYCPYSKHTTVICLTLGLYSFMTEFLEFGGVSNLP